MTYIGLGNYSQLMTDSLFWTSLKNTLGILFLGGLIIFPIAFLLTILSNSGIRGKKFFRAMIFLPNVIATIALTTLWAFIYNPQYGLLNGFFKLLGIKSLSQILYLAPDKIYFSMMVALIWIEVGFYLVLMMAGADKIPLEFYEAAKLEGANLFQMFRKITVPLLWDVISVAIVLWTIFSLKIFEFPYAFNGITPPTQIYTVGIYLYIMGFGKRFPIYRLGFATAVGVMLLFAVVLIVGVLRRVMRRETFQY
jgi:ABC-type sugar transport system permease subunit